MTLQWVDQNTAELVEVDIPLETVEALRRGDAVAGFSWPERRFSPKDARARIRARLDQVEAGMDDLVNEYPELKASRRRRRDDS